MTATGSFHVSITKELLLREIRRLGLRQVLKVPPGVSDAEMLARIERDPREHFVMDPACNRQDETGLCMGHPPDAVEELDPIGQEREAIAGELERRAKAYDQEGGGGALAAYALRDAAGWTRGAREKRDEREGGSER